jgi:hypothetical protein
MHLSIHWLYENLVKQNKYYKRNVFDVVVNFKWKSNAYYEMRDYAKYYIISSLSSN